MALTRGFIRNAVTTPLDARLMDMAKMTSNADGSPRVGVIGGANPGIVTTTSAVSPMTVAVAAAEFCTSKGKADGDAIFTNDGTVSVTIAAAPATNSRIDVIYVKHNDSTTGDGTSTPAFGVLQGTAAGSPTKPGPLPTGALELGTLRVFAGTTASNGGSNVLTNTYQMTAAQGGIVPFRTKAELDLWTTASVSQVATVLDTNDQGLYRYNGTAWKRYAGPMIGAKVMRTAAQSLGSGAFVNISFDNEVFDAGACWAVGQPTRLVAPIAGVYSVSMAGGLATGVPGRIAVQLRKNGAVEFGGTLVPTNSASEAGAAASTLVNMAAGDYLEMQMYQESGSTQNTGSSGYSRPTFSMMWQGEV